jgi:hypothetical protein
VIPPGGRALDGPHLWQAFFWEAKAPGKRPTDAQLAWMDKHRQVGLTVNWFDRFEDGDQPLPPCEPKNSHTFATWFSWFWRPA